MECFGAAQDTNAFAASLRRDTRPSPSVIVYDGVFNESYIRNSVTQELLECFPHVGRDRKGNVFVGLEVVSVKDGKPRTDPTPLDLVITVDVSGSMGSPLSSEDGIEKLAAAKKFTVELVKALRPDDRVALLSFSDTAKTIMKPMLVSECAANIEQVVGALTIEGGTVVSAGLTLAYDTAKKIRADGQRDRVCRVIMLSDMSSGEVRGAMKVLTERTVEGAEKLGTYVSYLGLGEDFDAALVEEMTVAPGCNYFSIKSQEDFSHRITRNIASAFFQTVKEVTVKIISKTHRVNGVYGGGKEGTVEEKDIVGWTRDREHLYADDKTVTLVSQLKDGGLPSDVVGLIVNQSAPEKAVICLRERSVFPSPISQKPGFQKGGWVLVELEPVEESATGGSAQFELTYTRMDDSVGRTIKAVSLAGGEMDEGMRLAMVLQQFTAQVKELLKDENAFAFPPEFVQWWEEQKKLHDLTKQDATFVSLKEKLQKLGESKQHFLPSPFF